MPCLDPQVSPGFSSCLVGLSCYSGWTQDEVLTKVKYASEVGAMQLGVFTLSSNAKYPEDYWWDILKHYLRNDFPP